MKNSDSAGCMNWARYKALCDQPGVWSRWMLQHLLEIITSEAVCALIRKTLAQKPIPKPAGHRGPELTDMFELSLTLREAQAVLADVKRAAGNLERELPDRPRLGGFIEAWSEYERYLTPR